MWSIGSRTGARSGGGWGRTGPHTILLLALTFFGLAYVAAAAEDNSSWFFSIPNEEFTRVLGDIYSQRGGAAPSYSASAGAGSGQQRRYQSCAFVRLFKFQ